MSGARAPARGSVFWAMAELRLALTIRRFTASGGVPEVVARATMLVLAVGTGAAFAVGTAFSAYRGARTGSAGAMWWLLYGLLLSWTALSLTLSDRESFDLRRLLVYPVRPAHSYFYELAAGLLGDPFAIVWGLMLLGSWVGAALARPGAWLAGLAVVYALFAAAVVCLVALVQELLARALRWRRARELGVAAIYITLLLGIVWAGKGRGSGVLRAYFAFREVDWIAYPAKLGFEAAKHLFQRRGLDALLWMAALAAATVATAWVAYRLALADALAGAEGASARGAADGAGWRLPGRVGPLLEKELKYLLRHPLVAVLTLVVPCLAGVVGAWLTPLLVRVGAGEVAQAYPLYGFALYALLVTQAMWLNAFGRDRGGARLWFLAPVPPALVLRAKNAAVLAVSAVLFLASAALLFATGGVPPLWAMVSAVALHLGAGFWFLAAGNLVSILNPRPGSHALQRGASLSPATALVGMSIVSAGSALFLPPVFLANRLENPWVLAAAWGALAILGAAAWRALLPAQGRLLARRREQLLAAVAGDDV